MKKIALTQGKTALVDDDDYLWLSQWKWHLSSPGYAVRTIWIKGGQGEKKTILMHREINKTPLGITTDHKDGNTLNNQKINLRTATHAENLRNQRAQSGRSSKYKGVYFHKDRKKWVSRIHINGRKIHLGIFLCEIVAAARYDIEAEKLFGQFAKTNF